MDRKFTYNNYEFLTTVELDVAIDVKSSLNRITINTIKGDPVFFYQTTCFDNDLSLAINSAEARAREFVDKHSGDKDPRINKLKSWGFEEKSFE